jgi:hypothetical protein
MWEYTVLCPSHPGCFQTLFHTSLTIHGAADVEVIWALANILKCLMFGCLFVGQGLRLVMNVSNDTKVVCINRYYRALRGMSLLICFELLMQWHLHLFWYTTYWKDGCRDERHSMHVVPTGLLFTWHTSWKPLDLLYDTVYSITAHLLNSISFQSSNTGLVWMILEEMPHHVTSISGSASTRLCLVNLSTCQPISLLNFSWRRSLWVFTSWQSSRWACLALMSSQYAMHRKYSKNLI